MAVYSVEGKLGTGKTKFCVWMAQKALREGRRVASNVDLNLSALVPELRASYIRVPDKPTDADFEAIGHGNPESYNEDRNGVLLLDELGTWLNSRTFQDKSRAGVIDWLIHARKFGWDVFLIVQNAQMIDRQVREALIEYQVTCVRLDKVRWPVVGKLLGKAGYMPRMHVATARVGASKESQIIAERWMYRGDDLHEAYDTRQVFSANYPHGPHTVLPPWGWVKPRTRWERLAEWVRPRPAPAIKPKARVVDALIRALPPDERVRHVRRLIASGSL